MTGYTSKDIQERFDITSESVRRWAEEFEEYLSPTANPGFKKTRFFSEEDVKVFALWHEISKRGGTYEDAHAQLKSGQRGEVGQIERQITPRQAMPTELEIVQSRMIEFQQKYETAQDEIHQLRDRVARAEQQNNDTQQERERIESELATARQRIEELIAEMAVLRFQLKQSDR